VPWRRDFVFDQRDRIGDLIVHWDLRVVIAEGVLSLHEPNRSLGQIVSFEQKFHRGGVTVWRVR
jgi:hypothetical protein